MNEAAGRAIIRQLREAHDRDRAFFDRLRRIMVGHICRSKTRSGGIHLDLGFAQVIGQIDGKHVESRL